MQKQLGELLRSTYTFTNNQHRRKAEQSLLELQKQPTFLPDLTYLILHDPNQQQKLAASTYIVKYTKDTLVRGSNEVAQQCGQAIINLLESDINYKYKVRIGTSMQFVLEKLGRWMRIQLSRYVQEQLGLVEKNPQGVKQGKFEQLIELGRLLMVNLRDDSSMNQYVGQSVNSFIRLLKWATGQITNLEPSPDLVQRLCFVKNLSNIVRTYFKLIKFDKNQDLVKITYNKQLDEAILKLLSLSLPNNPYGDCTAMGHKTQQANLLNLIKSQCISTFQLLMRALLKTVFQPSILSMNIFYTKSPAYISYLLTTLTTTLRCAKPPQMMSKCKDLVMSILRVIDFMMTQPPFYEEFFKVKNQIYTGIVLPLLEFSEKEVEMFEDEPEEFVEEMLYVVSAGQVKNREEDRGEVDEDATIKTLAAKLLNSLCRYQDGFMLWLFKTCLQKLTTKVDSANTVYLVSLAIAQTNVIDRMELIVAIRLYLQSQIRNLQLGQVPDLLPQPLPPTHHNLYYFLLYLLVLRYTKDINIVDNTFPATVSTHLAINLLGGALKPTNQASQILSLQILSQVSELYSLAVYQRAAEILEILTGTISKPHMTDKLFDYLMELIRENSENLAMHPEALYGMVGAVVRRVQYEVENQKPTGSLEQNTVINKCWNCLQLVSSTGCFSSYIPTFQQLQSPLYSYLRQPTKYPFEQHIILLQSTHIKSLMLITQTHLSLFPHLPKVFQKNKYLFYHLFELFNLYLYYGGDRMASSKQAMMIILQCGLRSMFLQSEVKGAVGEADNCEGVVLLQNFVYTCGRTMGKEMWESVIVNAYKRLKEGLAIKLSFLRSNLVALLAFCLASTIQIMPAETITMLLRTTLEHFNDFLQDYPTKVYCCSMTLVLRRFDHPCISPNFTHLLDCLCTLLRINYNRILIDPDSPEAAPKTPQQLQHQNSMGVYKSKLRDLDEYQLFKETVKEIKARNQQFFEKANKELIREKQMYLKTIMGLEKVEDNNYRAIIRVKRPQRQGEEV